MSFVDPPDNGSPELVPDTGLRKLRVALVITELFTGGAESCLCQLALYLARTGHAVEVWSLAPAPSAPRDRLVRALEAAGITIHFGRARGALSAASIANWLRKQLLLFRPDIVQSMLWHANVVTALAIAISPQLRRQIGSRQLRFFGGMRVSEPRKGRWAIERWASQRMTSLVCVSDDVMQHARDQQRIHESKLVVIPNGVAEELLDASDDASTSDQSIVVSSPTASPSTATETRNLRMLFVGRLEEQKAPDKLVEAIGPVLKNDLTTWRLDLLGQGTLEPRIKAAIADHRWNDSVHLNGWQDNALQWMRASEIVLLPAEYEGMPNVLLEAMALGKPFVAFDVDGVSQLFRAQADFPSDLRIAQVAPKNDWPAFIERVQELARSAELRDKCGQANRAQIRQNFRLSQQLHKYVALWRK